MSDFNVERYWLERLKNSPLLSLGALDEVGQHIERFLADEDLRELLIDWQAERVRQAEIRQGQSPRLSRQKLNK